MYTVVMPQTQVRKSPRFVKLEYDNVVNVCYAVTIALQHLVEVRQAELVRDEIARREQKAGWLRRLFRVSLDPIKVRDELKGANPMENDAWIFTTLDLAPYQHAVTRIMRGAHEGEMDVVQEDWALVLRAYHRFVC